MTYSKENYWEDAYHTLKDLQLLSPHIMCDRQLVRDIEENRMPFNQKFDNHPYLYIGNSEKFKAENSNWRKRMFIDKDIFIKALNGEDVYIELFHGRKDLYVCAILVDGMEDTEENKKMIRKYFESMTGLYISKYNKYFYLNDELVVEFKK